MKKKKVAIVTWYHSRNFGSQLQAYALYSIIAEMGFDVYMIFFCNRTRLWKIYKHILNALPMKFAYFLNKSVAKPRYQFVRNFMKEKCVNPQDFLSGFEAVVCGSDQIWAPNVFDSKYMLDFVPDGMNKFSYAASIGLNAIPNELKEKYTQLLNRLTNVSVREEKGKELLNVCCGIKASVVLDPTLLLSAKEWEKIEISPTKKESYIFCYFLNSSHNYKDFVLDYQNRKGCKIIGLSENPNDEQWMDLLSYKNVGPREFLGLIHNADSVITDSYHCTIFSLHFNKPFVTFERFKTTDKICQNSRIEQLNTYFNIKSNIVNPNTSALLDVNAKNYLEFENKRQELEEKSLLYLKNALLLC